jgi:hypothetical protein
MVNDNSQSQGDPALFRTRTINMLESDNFSEGDEVLIRFRLFADQFAYGWGWAIDNLSIQSPVTSSERPLTQSMLVYPSPVSTELHLKITNPFSGPVHLSITNLQGAVVYSQRLDSSEAETDVDVDVSRFADGLYIVKVAASGQTLVRKFTKAGR